MSAMTPTAAEALAERVFEASIATMDLACIHVGLRLGLYAALTEPRTAAELAERTSTDERYAREWLEQQAAAGLIACPDPGAEPYARRFVLIPGSEPALLDADSLACVEGVARATIGALSTLPQLLEAFRTGEGIDYPAFGEDMREGIAAVNRPMYAHQLAGWLAALPDLHERLSQPGARVADIACGCGYSSEAIARAYPLAHVDGFDEDAASIATAREHASERVRFFRQDASDGTLAGRYDLVTIFEAVHDMTRPVEALHAARELLSPGGCVIVADERVPERFTAPSEDPIERMSYGFSVVHCLPVGRTCAHAAATGTVMRPHTLLAYAEQAGFSHAEVLDIEHDFWRFYRLLP
jgi:2-polyprenyl-3-methyl-5-hydroxy-6-metoxy-1,4-benzoquinol methylase